MNSRHLISEIQQHPDFLDKLKPRQFEEVVAELLASFGWKISLTPQTRDGGYDVLAVSSDFSGLESSWLIECKRYSSGRKVGVETARQLMGVKSYLHVQNSIIVTSSDFSKDAKKIAGKEPSLHLVDRSKLLEWIQNYRSSPENEEYIARNSFYSCFVSHSQKDHDFARVLSSRLRMEGIRVWFAPEDMRPGEKMFDQIGRAIKQYDRLLIVLSEDSMASEWVKTELLAAKKKERSEKRQVLFPIGLAPIEAIQQWQCFDPDTGTDIAREVREYFIPDFSDWKKTTEFEAGVAKVVYSLRASDDDQSYEEMQWKAKSKEFEGKAITQEISGDFSGAAFYFEEATTVDSTNTYSLVRLGYALKRVGRIEEAISACTRAIEVDSGYECAYFNRACYNTILGKPRKEIFRDLQTAIRLRPLRAETARIDEDFSEFWNDDEFLRITTRPT